MEGVGGYGRYWRGVTDFFLVSSVVDYIEV